MSSERWVRIEATARDTMAEMLLVEVRRQAGLTQSDLANRLGTKQELELDAIPFT
jgi:DNA-binding XRE family transcriptional regulator